MKKQTKKVLCAVGAGAVAACAVVGGVILLGRSDSTHNASVITHGLKELGKLVGGDSMLAGVAVVAGTPVVAMAGSYTAAHFTFDEDTINQTVNATPPPAASQPVDPEPLFSQFNNMTEYMTALREWQARQPDAEDDIVAQYDRWEEAQRAQRPRHPMWERGRVVSLAEVRNKSPLDYLSDDELDEAI